MAHNTMNKRELYYAWQQWSHACDAFALLLDDEMDKVTRKEGEGDSVSAAVAVVTTGRATHAG
jgi:hypothetical protein